MDPLRARIVDELVSAGRHPDDAIAQIRGATRGNIVQVMRRIGVPASQALSAACRGAEVRPARGEWLRRPLSAKSHGVPPELCWKLLAAPISREDGKLCIAFADPEVAVVGTSLWGLPEHIAHLALEEHVRAVLKATLGRPGAPRPVTTPGVLVGTDEKSELEASIASEDHPISRAIEDALVSTPTPVRTPNGTPLPPRQPEIPMEPVDDPPVVYGKHEPILSVEEEMTDNELKLSHSEIDSFADGGETVALDASVRSAPPAKQEVELPPEPPRTPSSGAVRIGTGNVSVIDHPSLDDLYPPVEMTEDSTAVDETEPTDPEAEASGFDEVTGFTQAVTNAYKENTRDVAESFEAIAETNPEGEALEVYGIKSFKLLREIGQGGMAQVFFAERKSDKAKVALKVMDPQLARDPNFVERFKREVAATRALDHPNVVRVVDDRCEENSTYFLATEWIEGGTLRDLMNTLGDGRKPYQPLVPAALVIEILAQCLEGLAVAHANNIVHRDLKPVNLMISRAGLLKLCDFGIAKDLSSGELTRAGVLFGTPMYMSPEQVAGEHIDARSDLFAIGTLCLEMLSGENPFDDDHVQRSLLKVSQGYAPPPVELTPGVPALLDEVISLMMRPDPADRFASARDARSALEPLVRTVRRTHPDVLESAVKNPRRTRADLLAAETAGHKSAGTKAKDAGRTIEAIYRFGCACLATVDDMDAQNALNEVTREARVPLGDLAKLPREGASFEKTSARQGLADSNAGRGVLTALAWARRGQLVGLRGAEERYREIIGDDGLVPLGDESTTPITAARKDELDALRAAAVGGGKTRPVLIAAAVALVIAVILALAFAGGDDDDIAPETPTLKGPELKDTLSEGERLLRRGESLKAIEMLSPLVDDKTHGVDARLMRARAYLDRDARALAKKDLEKIVKATPPDDARHQEAQAMLSKL